MSQPFLGEIRMFAFNFAPRDWAVCNGQTLSISQYSALFALIGTTYGGNGTTTFQLPNLQSRVPIHQGQGLGLSPYVMGQIQGAETVILTTPQIPSHNHPVNCNTGGGNAASPQNNYPAVESTGTSSDYNTASNGAMASGMVGFTGTNQAHTNIQPYLCVNFCIAIVGIFPSRN
ncbi:MAG TPA: tail fiber protein [Verrucomicrobiae bacterium]